MVPRFQPLIGELASIHLVVRPDIHVGDLPTTKRRFQAAATTTDFNLDSQIRIRETLWVI